MLDTVIFFIAQHIFIVTLVVGIFNFVHILLYKGLNLPFVFFTFFIVFGEMSMGSKRPEKIRRYRFMRTHNLLTISFYSLGGIAVLLHFLLPG